MSIDTYDITYPVTGQTIAGDLPALFPELERQEVREATRCVSCGFPELRPVLRMERMPVLVNEHWPDARSGRNAPKGDIELAFCPCCGLIRNVAFDAASLSYSAAYDNALSFSPTFRRHALSVARRLIDGYDIRGKTVVDVGCGKGDFLALICAEGGNQGVGYDPSYDGSADRAAEGLRFFNTLLPDRAHLERADLVVCRQVLEHIDEPIEFLQRVAHMLDPTTVLDIEVPDAEYMLREAAVWDVIYEHVSYFSPMSLSCLIQRVGLDVVEVGTTFGDQYLYLQAATTRQHGDRAGELQLTDLSPFVDSFADAFERQVSSWEARLHGYRCQQRHVAVWGAGSKGVTFVNAVSGAERTTVVDVSPTKAGRHLAGTGQRIVPPCELREEPPDVVVVMNRLYTDEVRAFMSDVNPDAEILVA